ncbi:MAG: hypothetical protein QM784_37880 [Polyangiaceae bacterium]
MGHKPGRFRYANKHLVVLSGILTSLTLASSAAASQSAKLVYARAPDAETCGEEAALRKAVAHRLGYDPFVANAENTVVAELRGDGEGLRARIFVIERGNAVGGARELVSPTKHCDELMLATALAISIAIDPESIDRVAEDPPSPPPPAPSEPPKESAEPPIVPRAATSPTPPPKTRNESSAWFWRIGIGGFLASGPNPSPAPGVHGVFSVEHELWSLGIEPRWWAPTNTDRQASTGATASVSLASATLSPCLTARAFYGCYLLEVGRLVAKGEVDSPRRDVSMWLGQGLRFAYRFGSANGLGATAKLDGLYAVTPRVRMSLNGEQVYETPRLGGRLGLEVSYGF